MEHLPLPKDPTIGSFDIPFVCTEDYDGGDFMTYPERMGWSMKVLQRMITFVYQGSIVRDGDMIASFLQSWLYFGLLAETVASDVDTKAYQRKNDNGDLVLTTATLVSQVTEWSAHFLEKLPSMEDNEFLSWKEHLKTCFRRTYDVVYAISAHQKDSPENSSDVLTRVCLGIATLSEYLNETLRIFWEAIDIEGERLHWRSPALPDEPDPAEPIVKLMRARGWCPKMSAHLKGETYESIGKLWFYANLSPPFATDSHAHCSREECQSMSIDVTKYETAHINKLCNCNFYGPSTALTEIVEAGLTPLIKLSRSTTDGDFEVDVMPYTEGMVYVAISHVWADGYGNLSENSLPSCVLLYIQSCVNAVIQPTNDQFTANTNIAFWIDTLCLPRKPIALRRKGICHIADAFQQADRVLVFDTYLRRIALGTILPTEVLARISICTWTQRLWTISEGLIARKIFVQFLDRALDLAESANYQRIESEELPPLPSRQIFWEVLTTFYGNRGLPYLVDRSTVPTISQLRYGLRTRATSWSFDEPICLAILLRLDTTAIIQAENTEKMKTLWNLAGDLPRSLAFSTTTNKLTQEGYRWAPASFMGDLDTFGWDGAIGLAKDKDAKPTPKGLVIRLPALSFEASLADQPASSSKRRILEHCLIYGERLVLQDQHGYWYDCGMGQAWNQDTSIPWSFEQEPVLLLAQLPSETRFLPDAGPTGSTPLVAGLLALYHKSDLEKDVVSAQVLAHMSISLVSQEETEYWNRLKALADVLASEHVDEVEQKRNDPEQLMQFAALQIESYGVGISLLKLMKNVFEFRAWPLNHERMSATCYRDLTYLLLVKEWRQVNEKLETKPWCID